MADHAGIGLKRRLAELYGKKCTVCGVPLHFDSNDPDKIEGVTRWAVTHHIVGRSHHGTTRIENSELRCFLCKKKKHGETITEKVIEEAYS